MVSFIQRRTLQTINENPTEIELQKLVEVKTDSGGFKKTPQYIDTETVRFYSKSNKNNESKAGLDQEDTFSILAKHDSRIKEGYIVTDPVKNTDYKVLKEHFYSSKGVIVKKEFILEQID
mgnify:CR=1 FL=1